MDEFFYKEDDVDDETMLIKSNKHVHGISSISGTKKSEYYRKNKNKHPEESRYILQCQTYLYEKLPIFTKAFEEKNVNIILQICSEMNELLAFVLYAQVEQYLSNNNFFKMLRILICQDIELLPILNCIQTLIQYGSEDITKYFLSHDLFNKIISFLSKKIYLTPSLNILSQILPYIHDFSFLDHFSFEELIFSIDKEIEIEREADQLKRDSEEEDVNINIPNNNSFLSNQIVNHYLPLLSFIQSLADVKKSIPPIIPMADLFSRLLHLEGISYHNIIEITNTISALLSCNDELLGFLIFKDVFNILSHFFDSNANQKFISNILKPYVYACRSASSYPNAAFNLTPNEIRAQLFKEFNPIIIISDLLIPNYNLLSNKREDIISSVVLYRMIYLSLSFLEIFGFPQIPEKQYLKKGKTTYLNTAISLKYEESTSSESTFPQKKRVQYIEKEIQKQFVSYKNLIIFFKDLFIYGVYGYKIRLCKFFLCITKPKNKIYFTSIFPPTIFDQKFLDSLIKYINSEQDFENFEETIFTRAVQLLLNIMNLIRGEEIFNDIIEYIHHSDEFHEIITFLQDFGKPELKPILKELLSFDGIEPLTMDND